MCLMIPADVGRTIARSHDVAYLNGSFGMRNEATPIFITQPYMYIANNYDNFDCLVRELPAHAMGLRMLFPLWALTGLKFLVPSLVNFPIYVNKEELTTLADYFVICTASSTTQIKALSDVCEEAMERNGERVHHIEGHRGGTWVLMDFSSVVVHIFMDEARKFYDLERLWGDAQEEDLSQVLKPE